MSCRSTASELASIDGLILSYHRDLIGCRNKYRKDTINREIARLQSRRAAVEGRPPCRPTGCEKKGAA